MSIAQYRTLDVHCPQQTIIPPPFSPSVSPAPPGTSGAMNPKVFCSSHHMSVELPAGPISEIVLKGMSGLFRGIYVPDSNGCGRMLWADF